jgi:tRNA G10  N-methylase Trm11
VKDMAKHKKHTRVGFRYVWMAEYAVVPGAKTQTPHREKTQKHMGERRQVTKKTSLVCRIARIVVPSWS